MKKILFALLIVLSLSLTACTEKEAPVTEDLYNEEADVETEEVAETEEEVTETESVEEDMDSDLVEMPVFEEVAVPQVYRDEVHIAYQIFPIAFADEDGNGIGDLNGITAQLDYIKDDLNVDVIWLNPIHSSPSYHKYDVTDYYDIDLTFGNLDDYKRLLDEAHKRDIRVLMDFVINHTSSRHPWFLNANSDPESKYRDYYVWNNFKEDEFLSKNGWYRGASNNEYFFASFWSEMPELNFDNPVVREEIKAIATYWLDFGVDGFRIDAAKHVFDINEYPKGTVVMQKNYDWFKELNAHIKSVKPDAFLLLETWDSYNSIDDFLVGADSAFNFDMGESIISAVDGSYRKSAQNKLPKILKAYDKVTTEYVDSVFLANHDQNRVMSQLGGDADKAKLAATIEFTLPGLSWIYYGDEIGMTGVKPDENIREAFKWEMDPEAYPNSQWRTWNYNKETLSLAEQREDGQSIFNRYKEITTLKDENDVIRLGDYVDYEIGSSFKVYSFFRVYEGTTYFVIHNLSDEVLSFESVSESINLIYETMDSQMDGTRITMNPFGSLIVEVDGVDFTVEEVK